MPPNLLLDSMQQIERARGGGNAGDIHGHPKREKYRADSTFV